MQVDMGRSVRKEVNAMKLHLYRGFRRDLVILIFLVILLVVMNKAC